MQPAAYFARIRQICSRATCIEYQVEALFINFSLSTAKNGCRQGPGSGNLGESLVKATISQQQYRYQIIQKLHTIDTMVVVKNRLL